MSLWDEDEDDELHVSDEQMHTECDEAPVKVLRVWQRVIGDSLIYGIVMTTKNNTYVICVTVLMTNFRQTRDVLMSASIYCITIKIRVLNQRSCDIITHLFYCSIIVWFL